MRKYVKNYSNYVIKKKHQDTNIGTIYERDWVTIGSKERYGTWDKRMSYHGDSNFVFTTTNFPSFYRKQKKSPWISKYFYESVKDASNVNNVVRVNYKSNDIRDFAYYGSSEELVRSSVENIIRTFPGYMMVKDVNDRFPSDNIENISLPNIEGLYVLENPLGLNITSAQNNMLDLNDNKFLSLSYEGYLYTTNGSIFNEFEEKPKVTYVGNNNSCTRIEWLWTIVIDTVEIYGIDYFGKLIYLTGTPDFMIVPKEETMNLYFNSLDNFEQVLLNRESKPRYSNRFVTPKRNQYGTFEVIRNYTWPSNKIKISDDYAYYPIDISSASYGTFLTELIELASILDEIYTDNIWGRMVHEAIKNYDWSYKRTLNDDTVEDNIEGGMLVENLLRLYGRAFDNIKRSIEGIGFSTNVTYNGFNNVTEAELTDKLNYMGWEVFSIIPNFTVDKIPTDEEKYVIDESSTPEPLSDVKLGTNFSYRKKLNEYGGYNNEQLTPALMENEFMRRLIINSNRILKSKGTIESIDMVMGLFGFSRAKGDFEIFEEFRKTFLKPISYTTFEEKDGNYVNVTKTLPFGQAMFDEYGNNHIVKTNEAKRDIRRLYGDDKYSGIPLNEIYMKEKAIVIDDNGKEVLDENGEKVVEWRNYKLLAPYYKHNQRYDSGIKKFSELYFQADGGWAKFDDGDEYDNVDFMETINYLKVLPSVSDLFDQPYRNTLVGDIFYVISVADYCDYYKEEKSCPPESHFFVCKDRTSIGSRNGWENIDLNGDTPEARTALYLDSLTNNSLGNNPHVGYGRYDMGERYWHYMENPFAFALSDGRLNKYLSDKTPVKHINEGIALSEFKVSDPYWVTHEADNVISYVGGKSEDGKKLYKGNTKSRMLNSYFKDYTREELNELIENESIEIDNKERHCGYELYDKKNDKEPIFKNKEFDSTYIDNVILDQNSGRYIIDYKNIKGNKKYREEADKDYVLNSKVLVFKNNLNNKFFKMYFRDAILPYLIQVIPSTTMMRFVGLNMDDEKN